MGLNTGVALAVVSGIKTSKASVSAQINSPGKRRCADGGIVMLESVRLNLCFCLGKDDVTDPWCSVP